MVKAAAYSPSRLSVFQTCARQYYYQYVIRVPKRRGAQQSVGISLHGALEEMELAGGVGEVGVEGALAMLLERWESEGFTDEAQEAEARRQAEQMLRAYMVKWGERPGKPVMLETKLKAEYEGVPFLGIVDRVDRLPDGSLELIDYKSGRQPAVTPAVRQQLAIYRYLIREKLGDYPASVSVHHLAANTRVAVEMSGPAWSRVLDGAAESARGIEAEQDFDPRVSEACGWCDYNYRCLAYKRSRS